MTTDEYDILDSVRFKLYAISLVLIDHCCDEKAVSGTLYLLSEVEDKIEALQKENNPYKTGERLVKFPPADGKKQSLDE